MPPETKPLPLRSELVALLNACKQKPEDDVPRLILADWLEEQDETERATLLRLQCRERQLTAPEDKNELAHAFAEIDELKRLHKSSWLGLLEDPYIRVELQYGLLAVSARTQALFDGALASVEVYEPCAWVDDLELLISQTTDLSQLAASPHWKRVPTLRLRYAPIQTPHLSFNTDDEDKEDIDWVALEELDAMDWLTNLDLRKQAIGIEGARGLANWHHRERLRSLNLASGDLGKDAIHTLCFSNSFAQLVDLDLRANRIGDHASAALATSQAFPNLRTLNLSHNIIGDEGVTKLAYSPILAKVTQLNLYANQIGTAGATALLDSPYLSELTRLDLRGNRCDDVEVLLRERFGKAVWLSWKDLPS